MRIQMIIVLALLTFAGAASAQTAHPDAKKPATNEKPAATDKPKEDLDSFFKDAEKQTRKARERGHSNCVPELKEEKSEPVA